MPVREQLAALLSDTKWIILASIVFSALLLIPDQVLELYRIIYSESPLTQPLDFLLLHIPVTLIGIAVWFSAIHVGLATRYRIGTPARSFNFASAALLPGLTSG